MKYSVLLTAILASNIAFADAFLARNNGAAANLNVVTNKGDNSHFTNPASLMKASKDKKAIVSLGGGATIKNYKVVKDALDLSDNFDETEDKIDEIKESIDIVDNIIDLYVIALKNKETPETLLLKRELTDIKSNLASVASDIGDLDGLINDLNAKKLGGALGGNFIFTLPNSYAYPIAVYANNFTDVNVKLEINEDSLDILQKAQEKLDQIATDIEKVNSSLGNNVAAADLLSLKDIPNLLDKNTIEDIKTDVKNVEASGLVKAAVITELGFSFANDVRMKWNNQVAKFNVGYNLKAQRVDIYHYSKNVSNDDSSANLVTDATGKEVKLSDTHKETMRLNLDAGLQAKLNESWDLGVMLNNIRSYKIQTTPYFVTKKDKNGQPVKEEVVDYYKVRTQPIIGLSNKYSEKLTLSGNLALKEGSSFVSDDGNQPLNIGAEYALTKNWELRGGYNHDLSNKNNKFTGLGFGYTSDSKFWTIDTAIQIGKDSTYTGSIQTSFAF